MFYQKPLLIINGPIEIDISCYGEVIVYKFSSCRIKSKHKFKVLNDPNQLDFYADKERKDYVNWIFALGENSYYEKFKDFLKFDFFRFGDLSSMRNEIYPTFDFICNIKLKYFIYYFYF